MKDILAKVMAMNPLEFEMLKEAGKQHVGLPLSDPFPQFSITKSDIPHTAFYDFIYDRHPSDVLHKIRSDKGGSIADAVRHAYELSKRNTPQVIAALQELGHTYEPRHTTPTYHDHDPIEEERVLPFTQTDGLTLTRF